VSARCLFFFFFFFFFFLPLSPTPLFFGFFLHSSTPFSTRIIGKPRRNSLPRAVEDYVAVVSDATRHSFGSAMGSFRAIVEQDRDATIAALRGSVPVLVVHPIADRVVPVARGRELARALGAEFHSPSVGGHWFPWINAAECAAAIANFHKRLAA
jgi:pimeloyl-ACP methyl ester carboxylesterase